MKTLQIRWTAGVRPVRASRTCAGHTLACAVVLAALAAPCLSAQAQAQASASRFKPMNRSQVAAAKLPLSVQDDALVRVVVVMDAPSVADTRATRADHRITDQEHRAIHAQVMQQHATITGAIAGAGGKVLRHYAGALNGMRVEIHRSAVGNLAGLPGVVDVLPVRLQKPGNVVSVPYIGAPAVWSGVPGLRGEHVKIGIIDTGIDYTHANFGGPGTAGAYQAALTADTAPADPALFGPLAPRVKGGTDLVGDDYNADPTAASYQPVPHPDPNPLDCAGHGSHVAGTAAGSGVTAAGVTYSGPYDAQTISTNQWLVGPGVAPKADLYAIRVFGCEGSTDVVADAIDWAIENDMDVINMSLGSNFGTTKSADAVAVDNAARAGVIVVSAAGNAGHGLYIVGDPSTARGGLSVAATDAHATIPAVRISFAGGAGVDAIEETASPNNIVYPLPAGSIPSLVLTSGGALSLGCNASDYPAAGIPGGVVVVSRGTCSFSIKSANAQAAGAVAIAVVNNQAGHIGGIIDTGTIPFFSVLQSDTAALLATPARSTATFTSEQIPNPTFAVATSFSSGGPRSGDSALKPEITAPGLNVISTAMGTGNQGVAFSGTSMATPHVAGVAALVRQAHPHWDSAAIRAAVMESASPTALRDYSPRLEGAGLVQAVGATSTQVVVRGDGERPGKLSFGFAEFTHDYRDSRDILIENHGSTSASFALSATAVTGVPHTLRLDRSSVTVPPFGQAHVRATLEVPAATVGSTHDAAGNDAFEEVAGRVVLQPLRGSNNAVALTVPYYLVPRARAAVDAEFHPGRNTYVRLNNPNGAIAGNGDFYAWGLRNPRTGTIAEAFEPRAIGVQSNPISSTDSIIVFAVNTHGRFSSAAPGEYDIYVDANGDGVYDYVLFSADVGAVTVGSQNGQVGTFLFNLSTGKVLQEFLADAPTDGSTVLMPVYASDLGITPANPRLTYAVNAFDSTGAGESVPGTASFNVFTPSVSNAMFVVVGPHQHVDVPVNINAAEFAMTPALGLMVVTLDNTSGGTQANLVVQKP